MKCKCGFKFSGAGEFRNCEAFITKKGEFIKLKTIGKNSPNRLKHYAITGFIRKNRPYVAAYGGYGSGPKNDFFIGAPTKDGIIWWLGRVILRHPRNANTPAR